MNEGDGKLNIIKEKNTEEAFEASKKAILRQKIIIYPTDTLYGLGVNAIDEEMVRKIYEVKGREFDKKLSIIVSDFEMLKRFCIANEKQMSIAKKLLPGPFTLIFKIKYPLPFLEDTIAVRIPKRDFITYLVRNLGFPITATSANITGEKEPTEIDEICDDVFLAAEVVIDGGKLPGKPSTMIDLVDWKIVREGEGIELANKALGEA